MRIPTGSVDRYIYFVAVDPTDLQTREISLTGFTVYGSLNGAAAAAFSVPTVNETDVTNMPGVYELLLDEQTSMTAGNDTEELCLHITHGTMEPVTRTVELYRPETTEGNTLGVAATGDISGNVDGAVASVTAAILLPTIPTDWITADGIAAAALNGLGDWNINKTGYSLTQVFPTNFADMSIVITSGLVDITQAAADKAWGTAARTLTVADWNVGKTGYQLDATGIDAIWDEPLSGHNTGGTSGKALSNAAAFVVTDGTCDAAGQTSTNIRLASGELATTDIYKNDEIIITGGTGAGESALITAYDGTLKDCTVSPALVITCDVTSTYEILPAISHAENLGADAVDATSVATDAIDADAIADNAIDANSIAASALNGKGDWNTVVPPTEAQMNARTILTADYFDPAADTVALVTAVSNQVTADVTAISGDTVAADRLEATMDTMIASTATGVPTTTAMPDSTVTEVTTDHYVGRIIVWRDGAAAGIAATVTGYTTGNFTFATTVTACSAGDAYVLV